METIFYCHTRTGRAIAEKTMDDGNVSNTKDDNSSTSLANLYSECSSKLTANGHDFTGELSSPLNDSYDKYQHSNEPLQDEKFRKRLNPLRIHLGKRPFVDNSLQYCGTSKKRKLLTRPSETSALSRNTLPRLPKLAPKPSTVSQKSQFHNVSSQMENSSHENEKSKPVPRLVPKSQLLQYKQFKKGKNEKVPQLKEYAQSLGLQPMVKFKCRKCCSMSFKTLGMLKEHQLVCRAQSKEPTLSPESAVSTESDTSGPSRVTRKLYLCSACGTYYENWNLFLHMREVHNRHICLFCLGMFSKAEKLSTHLTNKHQIQAFDYTSKEDFFKVYDGTLYLMCCVCDEICSEQDDFFNHDCNNIKPKPVPVLISKNSIKQQKCNVLSGNGSITITNDIVPVQEIKTEKEDFSETKNEISNSQKVKTDVSHFEQVSSDTKIHSTHSISNSKHNTTSIDSTIKQESPLIKSIQSPNYDDSQSTEVNKMSNGDEHLEHSNGQYLSDIDDPLIHTSDKLSIKSKERSSPPLEKEKEGGIKLKLSLNNANSPVIINSTVDPTVGIQNSHKPPSRMRRPPKRYEKNNVSESVPPPLKTNPSIKMTICDSADKPFVKTTIYEDSSETLRTLNNNVDAVPKTPEYKSENIVKSTIYDNKIDDENSLNRVPKLTVRVPKELLDKDSSSDYSSDSDVGDRLTVDEGSQLGDESMNVNQKAPAASESKPLSPPSERKEYNDNSTEDEVQIKNEPKLDLKTEPEEQTVVETKVEAPPIIDETPVIELTLDRPIDKYPLKDLLKVFLSSTVYNCIYCNHVRKIAVNCEQLCLHMAAQHRFSATVDSITAEVLMPETIALKVKTGASELRSVHINLDSYDSVDKCENVKYDHLFECFQCYFKTAIHKDLYSHNRKMHQKTILLCVMCKSNFYSYSELLCHLCPGTYDSEYEIKFRCCLCSVDCIPSSFRLMVHLRKIHHTCEVCLEFCYSQARLSNHVWKHKLHHLCYRCGIAYRNKPDITKHLFWKHGTESVMCKKCLQKKWPHVYHFCSPPATFICDECSLQFTKAVFLKVHKRFHSGEYPHICTEDGCTEKFVSKRLLSKHIQEHTKKQFTEKLDEEKPGMELAAETSKDVPFVDLVNNDTPKEAGTPEVKLEAGPEQPLKKSKKKKNKDRDSLLIDVNLPALNLSESDSSEESDTGIPSVKEVKQEEKLEERDVDPSTNSVGDQLPILVEEKKEIVEEKPDEQQVLDIWNNFQKYQEKVDKQREKTPPLVPIKKHVCESDHDYCLIPTDFNGDNEMDKKKCKKPKTRNINGSSSSSSSSDSDSTCSCGSNCSCSSSSGSSSSSSSDSDSSDEEGKPKKKDKRLKKVITNRRVSSGSNVDVMGMSETPVLVPEKPEPLIAESDLETDESETDEEFYDEHPQQLANKLYAEKRNQLLLLASVAPSDGGSVSGEVSRSTTPITHQDEKIDELVTKKQSSSKKKSKKKKKSRNAKKCAPIKINIPKDITAIPEVVPEIPLAPNKITISLQSNTVQIPEASVQLPLPYNHSTPTPSVENKRSSKRRRVPNKFYGYSSDEELPQSTTQFKPQQPPKLEWRKEDLPSPVNHKAKKVVPLSTIPQRLYNYSEPYRLTAPIPDPEPPKILMNTESMESSNSDSSDEGALEIYQPNSKSTQFLAPTYLNSGTSSLPYKFQRPAIREAKEGESVYCYCRCPYDEVSEMIGCDAEGCPIEWFHFECVGIMVPPKGKWYCPECRKNQSLSGYR